MSARKDVLCPLSQQTEQDLLLWTADHGSCPDSVQTCDSQSNSHGCLVHQSFLGAAVHVCTGTMHCPAQPNNTDPATRDPDLPEAQSRTPLLDHANGTHPNQCRPCFLLFLANSTLFLRPNILDEQACSAQGGYDAHFVENWCQEKPFELLGVVPNLATVNSSDHSQRPAHSNGSQHQTRWRECEAENPKHAEWESTLSHFADGCERPKCTRWPSSASTEDTFSLRLTADSDARRDFTPGWPTCDELWESTRV